MYYSFEDRVQIGNDNDEHAIGNREIGAVDGDHLLLSIRSARQRKTQFMISSPFPHEKW